MQLIKGLVFLLVCSLGLLVSNQPVFSSELDFRPITPIPPNPIPTEAEQKNIALGKKLFNDTRLSASKQACGTCHSFKTGGHSTSPPNTVAIPTIFNARYNFKQFWNARARTLKEAVKISLLSPDMVNFDPKRLDQLIEAGEYPRDMDFNTLVNALTAYVKTLTTPGSRFDQYLLGNVSALNENEKKGYELFKNYGCISCHQGRLVGGNIVEKLGIYKEDYFKSKPQIQPFDLGYYQVTHNPKDKFVFKVPSLRNIALRSPYLHDGGIKDLDKVVELMAISQLGHPTIPQEDVKLIVQFLYTLTGQIPKP